MIEMDNGQDACTAAAPGKLSVRAALRCVLRSGLVNAAYNLRGLQNIGFTYAIAPGLRCLYPDDRAFAQSCRRYAVYHNCHPFWAPFLVGALLHTEAKIASGQLDPAMMQPLKDATLNSLSAIGDSFFSGSLEAVLFVLFSCLVVKGYLAAACIAMLCWLALSVLMRLFTFYIGISRGLSAVGLLRSFNLINVGDYIKIFGALVLVAFLAMALDVVENGAAVSLSVVGVFHLWAVPVLVLLTLAYFIARLHYPRALLVPLLLLLVSAGVW